ncbi:MAG: M23 family metallopeptidase, partial [Muribaculaceae bacterium]|nr:M23 family metallopeptidase [Muribaculaceae bacterium]
MNKIKTFLFTLAMLSAGISAARADELSELVAAVVASVDTTMMSRDIVDPILGNNKHRYKPKAKEREVSLEFIDRIYNSMNRQALQALRRDNDEYEYAYSFHPTLGRQDFFRPVAGIITSKFGWRPQFQRVHHGVDLHLNIGDTVRAALSGTVERISYDADGYGHYVVMSHPDGMETVYGHLQYALVGQGQAVNAGQPLAIGGNTGNSTGPHLHFEARLNGVAVDPMLLFDFYGNSNLYAYESVPFAKTTPKGPTYSHQSKSLKKDDTYIVRYG